MDAAKDLFFRYDGSWFYMSRDGVDREYAAYNIPRSTEKLWLKELTTKKLAALGDSGNWRVIHFLIHHADFAHLPEILAVHRWANFGRGARFWRSCSNTSLNAEKERCSASKSKRAMQGLYRWRKCCCVARDLPTQRVEFRPSLIRHTLAAAANTARPQSGVTFAVSQRAVPLVK